MRGGYRLSGLIEIPYPHGSQNVCAARFCLPVNEGCRENPRGGKPPTR